MQDRAMPFVTGLAARGQRNACVLAAAIFTVAAMMLIATSGRQALAQDANDPLPRREISRPYADARTDLQNAIINQGLTIDYNGKLGEMLKRTAADVGAKGDLYINAEYFTFCSSRLSRKMMDADPNNLGLCPYMMFLFERVDSPGKVTVGYKQMPMRGNDNSKAALAEINTLLATILKEATE